MFRKKSSLLILLFLFVHKYAIAQNPVRISGFVKNALTGESLPGVTIWDTPQGRGVSSNAYGFFSLKTTKTAVLRCSAVGFSTINIQVKGDSTVQVAIWPQAQELDEVVVKAESLEPLSRPIGELTLPVEQLKQIPTIFGEKDILKALTLTPGVSNGNEGTVGLYIRGGSPDQNLILLDETPVYNTSHAFGLASIFNASALKNVTLYKGIFPAQYGGRLSSVIDVTMKEGNTKQIKKEFSIGLLSYMGVWEGPWVRKGQTKGSFLVSGRSSYLGLLTLPVWLSFKYGKTTNFFSYWAYDLTGKVNYRLDDKSDLYLSVYYSRDAWNAQEKETPDSRYHFGLNWGNTTGTLRYNRIIKNNLFLKGIAYYTAYQYKNGIQNAALINRKYEPSTYYEFSPSLSDLGLKMVAEYFPTGTIKMTVGIEGIQHYFAPTRTSTSYALTPEALSTLNRQYRAFEAVLFNETQWHLSKRLTVNAGLRIANYEVPQSRYPSVEPRLSTSFMITDQLSVKAGYARMRQFIHLLNNYSVGFSNDIWVPSTATIPPQFAEQVSTNITMLWPSAGLEFSLEGYYKRLDHLIDLPTGNTLVNTNAQGWERNVPLRQMVWAKPMA